MRTNDGRFVNSRDFTAVRQAEVEQAKVARDEGESAGQRVLAKLAQHEDLVDMLIAHYGTLQDVLLKALRTQDAATDEAP
jgi:hypothetical protein